MAWRGGRARECPDASRGMMAPRNGGGNRPRTLAAFDLFIKHFGLCFCSVFSENPEKMRPSLESMRV